MHCSLATRAPLYASYIFYNHLKEWLSQLRSTLREQKTRPKIVESIFIRYLKDHTGDTYLVYKSHTRKTQKSEGVKWIDRKSVV